MLKRLTVLLLAVAMTAGALTACGGSKEVGSTQTEDDSAAKTDGGSETAAGNGEVKEFTAFFATPGAEINDNNEISQMLAEKTGVKVKETWLTGQTASEAIGTIIAGGEYPDFINGVDAMAPLYDAEALIPWDDYIDKYPNIKEIGRAHV